MPETRKAFDRATDAWLRIEHEAREQVREELGEIENTTLEHGYSIAWVECRFGRTDGMGRVHRIGTPFGDAPMTLCGEKIPAPIRRVPLNPNLVQTLGRCHWCEERYVQKGAAA